MIKKLDASNAIFIFCLVVCLIFTIVFWSAQSIVVFFSTVLGMLASKSAKDGKWYTFLFDIISYVFYIQICFNQKYFGETILSFIIIVFNLVSLKEWKTHLNKDFVEINKINKNEMNLLAFTGLISFIIYTIFLININSTYALINAFCTISFLLGNYFCFRRSILQFYFLILYEIAYIALWLLSAVGGNITSLVLLLGGITELIYDILGIVNWKKASKLQVSIQCKTYYFSRKCSRHKKQHI